MKKDYLISASKGWGITLSIYILTLLGLNTILQT